MTLSSASTPLPAVEAPHEPAQKVRPSRAVVAVEVPLARIRRELEASIPVRVADDRGRSIGVAGYLDTTVDRGPFSIGPSASGNELVVRTKLTAVARACTSSRGCYASCSPEAIAEVTVAPELGADYNLPAPHLTVRLVRGCRVSALGGFLSLDLTPTIEAQLAPQVARAEHEIAARLPHLRPRIEREYAELAKPHELPLGAGCALVRPSGIAQGPAHVTAEALTVRLALLVSPEVRPQCDAPAALPSPLPPLTNDPRMPSSGELDILEHVPLARFGTSKGLGASFPAAAVVRGDLRGAQVHASLAGELCGDVDLHGYALPTGDGSELTLGLFRIEEAERARITTAGITEKEVLAALDGHLRAPLKITPGRMKAALPALLPALSTSDVTLTGNVLEATSKEATLEGDEALAKVHVRLDVVAKVAP